jgi:hypothetical protein
MSRTQNLNLRKSKKLRLKGTSGTIRSSLRGPTTDFAAGVWEGFHAGLKAHLKYPRIKGMTAIAGLEAGLVLVYLDPLDEFTTPTSAEASGAVVTAHAGGDWNCRESTSVPGCIWAWAASRTYQLGVATNFAF